MNFNMFIEFPGILITIGVLFLIASIILGIIAYKKSDVIVEEETKEENSSNFFKTVEANNEEKKEESNEPIAARKMDIEEPEEVMTETLDTPDKKGIYEYSFDAGDTSFKNINEVEEEEIELL